MQKGYIFDVFPDYIQNKMITWLVDNGKSTRIQERYEPSFYVHANTEKLYHLASLLHDSPQIKTINFTYEKIKLGTNKKKLVLEITPKKIIHLSKIAETINKLGNYHEYQLYNVDIRLPTRYLQHKKTFCNAYTKWDGKNFITEDSAWDIDYKIPRFKISTLDIKRKIKGKITTIKDPISMILIDNNIIAEENETDTILSAVKFIQQKNPDIIYTQKGDNILFPYLYHRAKENKIEHMTNLGREKKQKLQPFKQEKSYFSYGQILYRPAFYTLKGRAHIDTTSSFMFGESGLFGLIDISRCSNIPLQLLSRLGPGTAISQMQVNKALDEEYIVPWKKNQPEQWKNMLQLLSADRGGLILDPKIGIHENIIELDFASLYPNIMLKFNISPETMLCNCCPKSTIQVPQLKYHICEQKKGLITEVLEPIIKRRFCFKARGKNKNYNQKQYQEMQMAWKWILLVCFGYTGYKNARYGRIECYESITAYSRDILTHAVNIAEKQGYKVLHGIIDSLWVKPTKQATNPYQLARKISTQTGIRIDVEAQYKWIVFLPCKNMQIGALNRYYGAIKNGELKIRGIELRQRNTPPFLKNLQKDILQHLQKANNIEEFNEKIPETIKIIHEHAKKIIRNQIDKKNLLIKTRISRHLTEYKVNNLTKAALMQLKNLNIQPQLGQNIRYIVTDEQNKKQKNRVKIKENLQTNDQIDIDYYLRQIAKCSESILTPFGYTIEKIEKNLQKIKKREKQNVSILS